MNQHVVVETVLASENSSATTTFVRFDSLQKTRVNHKLSKKIAIEIPA